MPEESDILCTHPMFGPDSGKNGWTGLNFMYDKVRIRDEATCSSFLQIFASEVSLLMTWLGIQIIKGDYCWLSCCTGLQNAGNVVWGTW